MVCSYGFDRTVFQYNYEITEMEEVDLMCDQNSSLLAEGSKNAVVEDVLVWVRKLTIRKLEKKEIKVVPQ